MRAVLLAAFIISGRPAWSDDSGNGKVPDKGAPDRELPELCPDIAYAQEGQVDVTGGKLWYGIYGEGSKPPLVVVHGGPGATHYYPTTFMKELADADGRLIIFYDQLGCGKSERPSDTSLWTVERFKEELTIIMNTLGYPEYHVWGHSWGTQLALNYAATKPAGLLSLTLASPIIDMPTYRQDLLDLLAQLPQRVQDGINNNEPGSPPYVDALNIFYGTYLVALDPWPDCWLRSFSEAEFGYESYVTTIGTDELNYTGNLKDRDDSPLLAEVETRIWFNCGANDIAIPARCMEYYREVPGSRMTIYQNSSHAFFDEERPQYLSDLADFLNSNDNPQ